MIRYEHPELFYLFTIIPFLIMIFWLFRFRRRRALKKFGKVELLRQMAPLTSATRPMIRLLMVLFAIASLVVAMANPQIGSRLEEGRVEGVDIVVALDVSRSMLAQDIRPNRLERARHAVNRLIEQLEQDRIGIVVFAGASHTQVPLTTDHHAARMLLRIVNTNTVSVQGTEIERAIDRALMTFGQDDMRGKTIILISDGESHDDDPLEAAGRARESGVTIHTVGIGSREGAPIPIIENDQIVGYLRDNQGNTVISRYDEVLLRDIAEATGGIFRHGTGADMGLEDILSHIRGLEQDEIETMQFVEYESRFYYFVALALFLLILEMLIMSRKNKLLRKIKII